MKMTSKFLHVAGVGLAGILTFACTGTLTPLDNGPGPDGGPPDVAVDLTPKEFFVQNVYQATQDKCGNCHTAGTVSEPYFVGANADETYDLIKDPAVGVFGTDTATSTFYSYAYPGPHAGTWNGTEAGYIAEWIDKENGGGEPQLSPGEQAFTTNVFPLVSQCAGCHGGTPPAFVTATAAESYQVLMAGYPSAVIGTTAEASTFYTIDPAEPAHANLQWDAAAATAIQGWIDQEYIDYQGQ